MQLNNNKVMSNNQQNMMLNRLKAALALTKRQKYDKITNLLSSLKRKGIIDVDKNRNLVLVK